ncbi:MAG: hypothetical protein WC498_02950 [Candidatus Saccharimonadales bacterium]
MKPDYDAVPHFDLPEPNFNPGAEATPVPLPEKGFPVRPELMTGMAPPATPIASSPYPIAPMPSSSPQQSTTAAQSGAIPQAQRAEETEDTLTKISVARARNIVAQTAGDPYSQNEQLNKLKAEYIKQRFNQDVKLAQG